MLNRWALILIALPLVVWVSEVHAQSAAAAQALFDEGLALREQGKIKEACAKFDESLRLEATVSTRFNLADCFARIGRHASAWSHFLQVAADMDRVGDAERAEAARNRAKALEPKLSKMVIKPAEPEGLTVKRNGEVVGQAQWASALPIDPGTYTIEATAPGKKAWSSEVKVSGEGSMVTVNIPALEDAPIAVDPGPQPVMPGVGPTGPEEESATPMIVGLTLGGLGLAGVGIGVAFGVIAINKKNEVDDLCPDLNNCTQEGIDTNDDAKTAATVSTIAIIAGGVLVATGIVLWLTLPSKTEVGLSPTGASFRARF